MPPRPLEAAGDLIVPQGDVTLVKVPGSEDRICIGGAAIVVAYDDVLRCRLIVTTGGSVGWTKTRMRAP